MSATEQIYRDSSKVFKDYKAFEEKNKKEIGMLQTNSQYSKRYKNQLMQEKQQELAGKRGKVRARLQEIRKDYMQHLDIIYDMKSAGASINAGLKELLNSGIKLTDSEWQEIASKYDASNINSRMIHDKALDSGKVLDNYISKDKALMEFDNLSRRITNSLGENEAFPIIVDSNDCDINAGRYYKKSTVATMEIHDKAESLEEAITREANAENEKFLNDKNNTASFLAGFKGTELKEEQRKLEILDMKNPDNWTDEEMEDAKSWSTYNGTKGKITPETIDYITSQDYKDLCSERDAEREIEE